jgi:hypothetical protein
MLMALCCSRAQADDTTERVSCSFDPADNTHCGRFACVPSVPSGTDENMIEPKTPGFCGRCTSDRFCGGAACNQQTGVCATFKASPRPEPVWPHFHLMVTDVTVNLLDSSAATPFIGAGYMFQGAFRKTHPESFDGHGYLTRDLPRIYWDVAATLAVAGPAQNLFIDAGLAFYIPAAPLFITSVALRAEYQRQGHSIWNPVNDTRNDDRLGPAIAIGILQNLYLHAAYVFALRGPNDHGALLIGLMYMKDLLQDLVADRYQKFLPSELK